MRSNSRCRSSPIASRRRRWAGRSRGSTKTASAEDNIRLVRQARAGQKSNALQPGQLPPFVRVTRTLHLGPANGAVDTTVQRLTASDTAITLQVPLLAGEVGYDA